MNLESVVLYRATDFFYHRGRASFRVAVKLPTFGWTIDCGQ